MKKKGLAPGGISWSAWKLHSIVVSLTFTIVLCMLAFLSLQRFSPSHSQLPSSMLSRRSLHSYLNFITPHEANPKVAFLFLARRHLPLNFLWNCFLQVDWGEANMIEAERLLLEEALKDPGNRRFILLSESCIQLYNFSYVYSYLMASPRSFVDSFLDMKERCTVLQPKHGSLHTNEQMAEGITGTYDFCCHNVRQKRENYESR